MAVTLTPRAAQEIKAIIKDQAMSDQVVLRVGIKGRNIQGFNYILDLTEVSADDDVTAVSQDIKVVCDPTSFPSLDGTEIDFKDEAGGRGFTFKNPHATRLPVKPAAEGSTGAPAPTASGESAADGTKAPSPEFSGLHDKVLEAEIIEKLRTIFDPEIPVNIYDLGLIYKITILPEREVIIDMTLTAPGCPVAGSMPPAVAAAVETIAAVKGAKVNLVWDPPWSKDRMSEEAQLALGLM